MRIFRRVILCILIAGGSMAFSTSSLCGILLAQETEHKSTEETVVHQDPHSPALPDCKELVRLLEQQQSQHSKELGQIRREIAALRDTLSKPGALEVFAGIGYILGLTGIAFYVHCRRTYGSK